MLHYLRNDQACLCYSTDFFLKYSKTSKKMFLLTREYQKLNLDLAFLQNTILHQMGTFSSLESIFQEFPEKLFLE